MFKQINDFKCLGLFLRGLSKCLSNFLRRGFSKSEDLLKS